MSEGPRDLEDDHERLRLALLTGGIGTWDWDVQSDELRWSARHAEILGYPNAPMVTTQQRFHEQVHEDDRAKLGMEFARALAAPNTGYALRFRIVRAGDGAIRWLQGRGRFFHDDRGELVRATGVIRDVTEEVEAAAALAANEERLRLALASSDAGVWDLDAERGVFVLDTVAERLGYDPAELGDTLEARASLVPPEDRPRAFGVLGDVANGTSAELDLTFRMVAKDGSLRWHRARGRAVAHTPEGRVKRVVGVVVDETAREETERQREAVSDLLAEALAHMPILVALYDATGRVLWINAAYTEVLGWTLEDVRQPGSLASVVEGEAAGAELVRFMSAADGRTWKEFPTRTKDGRVFPTAWCNVRLPDGRMLGIGKDSSLENQLAHAQKMESLGVLAGGIAHDFNNLLVGILGNANLAASEIPRSSSVAPLLEDIEAAAHRAADLTRQLLAYAGKGRFVIEPVDLGALAREMRSLLASVISKSATLEIVVDEEGGPVVSADATQLRQVLMNLIVNGSDALGEGEGTIRVRVDTREEPEANGGLPGRRHAVLSVEDSGAGMSEAVRARIFEPFFTTKFAGRGLGLAATLGIVRSHGGSLRVTSEVGRGTTFEVVLPLAEGEVVRRGAAARESTPAAQTRSATVLVVDDEASVRKLAARLLERRGHRVLAAGDGREALEIFARERVDLVLLDVTMPHLSGKETLRELRARAPGVPVLLMSGYDPADVASRVPDTEVAGFVQKPFDGGALVARVDALLERLPR